MPNITVTITDTQNKCLEYSAYSVQDWCENSIHERARIAQEEIISKLITHCNANNIAIATGADAQVTQAYSLGVVKTAKQITDESKI
tara:strand:+ start:883 stop:1143 length:261 start_codon:yes stop_codon:yes gene_type:complete